MALTALQTEMQANFLNQMKNFVLSAVLSVSLQTQDQHLVAPRSKLTYQRMAGAGQFDLCQ